MEEGDVLGVVARFVLLVLAGAAAVAVVAAGVVYFVSGTGCSP